MCFIPCRSDHGADHRVSDHKINNIHRYILTRIMVIITQIPDYFAGSLRMIILKHTFGDIKSDKLGRFVGSIGIFS